MQINPLFDDIDLNKFEKNLTLIPDDIKREIYEDYFEPIIKARKLCDELVFQLNSINSIKLNIIDILPLLNLVLENKYAIEYLYNNYYYKDTITGEKINYFKILYEKIIKNKDKNFILINNPIEDFALSWLMHLYH